MTATRRARSATPLRPVARSAAETRVVDAAVYLFGEHVIAGTSLSRSVG